MTEKQIIDKLNSINLSLKQKKDLIDIIKDITASSGGSGGTSTDKDILYIYINEQEHIIINDKEFLPQNSATGDIIIRTIHDEELYHLLYNSLFNTNKIIYIKLIPNDEIYFFSVASYLLGEGNYIHIESYIPSIGNIFIHIYKT